MPPAGDRAGFDAANAELTLPETFSFKIAAGQATVSRLAEASWTLYGQRIDFAWRPGPSPAYEPRLQSMVIPLSASVPDFEVGATGSPFAEVEGRARIERAGWTLPVTAIDVANPVEAAGIGGLAVRTEAGLTLGWRGLRDGPARQVGQLLVASITWTKAPEDTEPDAVDTRFAFAPLGPQDEGLAAWTPDATVPTSTSTSSALFQHREPNQVDWDRHFARFGSEQFALLDVSSNADQMGVSFAWFNPREVNERDPVFHRIYGEGQATAPGFPLRVQNLDLAAESRYVRAFTVPQVSWEPLVNLTPPGPVFSEPPQDPPHGFNLFPDDGGPTRLLNDGVEWTKSESRS